MVYILLGTGFEEMEAISPLDLLRRANIPVMTVGIGGSVISGAHGIDIQADISLEQMDLTVLDMIVIPGGRGGVDAISSCPQAMHAIRFAWENQKFVAAICAGPSVVATLGITEQRNVTCYPGWESKLGHANLIPDAACVRDGNLITGTSAGCAVSFGLALVEALKGSDAAKTVADALVIR